MEAVSQPNCVNSHQTLPQMFLPFFFFLPVSIGGERRGHACVCQAGVCVSTSVSVIHTLKQKSSKPWIL